MVKKKDPVELTFEYSMARAATALDLATETAVDRKDMEALFTAAQIWMQLGHTIDGGDEEEEEEYTQTTTPFGFGMEVAHDTGYDPTEGDGEPGSDEEPGEFRKRQN